jgi:AcrR family transcriptional regulator
MERDYPEVSTEQVLERSGISRGALYHHFPSKLDLFRAVFVASEQRVIARIAAQAPVVTTPFEALLALAMGYLRAAESDEELRRIGLGQGRAILGWEDWRATSTQLGIGVAMAAVSAAVEAGELLPHDPETLATVLLGGLIDAATLIAVAEDRATARGRCEEVIVDLLEGLRR